MLPPAHFLFALFISAIGFKQNYFSIGDVIIIAIFAMLIDIDHLVTCYSRYHTIDIKACWNKALTGKAHLRSIVHHRAGIVWVLIIIVLISLMSLKFASMMSIGYISHLILDNIVSAKKMRKTYILPHFSYEDLLNSLLVILIVLVLI